MRLRDNDRVIVNTGGDDSFGRLVRVDGEKMNRALKGCVLVQFDSGGHGQWIDTRHVRLAAHPVQAFSIGQTAKWDGRMGKVTRTLPTSRAHDGHVELRDADGVHQWVPIERIELIV